MLDDSRFIVRLKFLIISAKTYDVTITETLQMTVKVEQKRRIHIKQNKLYQTFGKAANISLITAASLMWMSQQSQRTKPFDSAYTSVTLLRFKNVYS